MPVGLNLGIVGLPNVGKSTLFNALTRNNVLAANYPFATIEPNEGVVPLPDPRLPKLAEMFNSEKIVPAPQLHLPVLTDLPFLGRILFGQDAFVYLSLALTAGIWWLIYRTRWGLVMRAVGDNHVSAHALGYPVLTIRTFAVLFGGACAGLGGAYLPLAYTPFFIPGMTAGRGWIALALVVFASWLPGRLVAGAYLFGAVTILQLHAQGAGFGIPSQLMSSLPYLATVVVLVVISGARGTARSAAPASLGLVFVPDR